MTDPEVRLSFDLIARGWAKIGDEWKLVEIDLTKYAEFRDGGVHVDDWYETLTHCMYEPMHTIWVKDDHRDQAIFEGTFE